MKITKLDMNSFGKFKNRTLELKDGINVIYGKNEAGKTTTHSFIQGMFFGFFKPYTKNKKYSAEYEKYRPWNSDSYRGSLDFTMGKGRYRIERDFLKGREDFRFIDETSGKDLTKRLPYNNSIKQYAISPVLGLNSELFRNTVSISQLGNRTDSSLKKEISETLVNYENGNDNNISVSKALMHLEGLKKEIGTRNQKKSPLGFACARLDELKAERDEIIRANDENRDYHLERKNLELKYRSLRNRKDEMDEALERSERRHDINVVSKYLKARDENDELADRIADLEKYKDIDSSVYTEFMTLNSENETLKGQLADSQSKMNRLEEELAGVSEKSSSASEQTLGKSYRKICSDLDILKDRLGNIERLEKRLSAKKNDKIEKDFSSKSLTNLVMNILLVLSIVAAGFMLAFSFSISKSLLVYFYIAAGLALILGIVKIIVSLILRESSKTYVKYDTSLIRTQNMIELNEVEINSVLAEYGSDNPYALIEFLEQSKKTALENNEFMAKQDKLTIQINDLEESCDNLERKIEENDAEIDRILKSRDIADAERFKEAFESRAEYEKLVDRFDANSRLLESLEEDNDIDSLIEKYEGESTDDEEIDASMVPSEDKSELENDITETLKEIARINGILEESDAALTSLGEVDEEIASLERQISEYEARLASVEKAEETIRNLSGDIHAKAAPGLNETLGNIMSEITGGKYSTVRVDDEMNVMVLDEKSGQYVDATRLSNGTIDQVYLALRLSIIENLLLSNKMPVIVDDCFIQYDDDRLREVLGYLSKLADKKQIIMFTCQNREENIMNELNVSFNRIEL